MELTEERLHCIMAYCREDPEAMTDAEKALFCQTVRAQISYLEGAGVRPPLESGPAPSRKLADRQAMYELVLDAMTLDAWDRRDMTMEGHIVTENPALRRMINQLKLEGDCCL